MAKAASLSLSELESLLKEQKSRLAELQKRQSVLKKELDGVNSEISVLKGKGRTRGTSKRVKRRRPKNAQSLRAVIIELLSANKKGMNLQEIHDAVVATGYKSNSKNFKNVVYQTLYHKDEFVSDSKTGNFKLA
ncbi:MAG TPA: hypothetical protein VMM56_01500 [Planctomycetaceae bacterium]|nr:hypothetical protein [Planctomycetaceae bacterium]